MCFYPYVERGRAKSTLAGGWAEILEAEWAGYL